MNPAENRADAPNRIDAHIEFSFRGESYELTSTLDLDRVLEKYLTLPSLHIVLAVEHGIDTYSYLYEVMQEAEIEFSNPQGWACDYTPDGAFDQAALAENWHTDKALVLLQPVAARELGIADLNQHSALKNALIAAYNLGRNA